MSDKTSLEFIGTLLRQIQAEQGTLRAGNHLTRMELGRFATREELFGVFRTPANRIGDLEVVVETRFDQLTDKLAQINEKLAQINDKLAQIDEKLGRQE